MPITNPFELSRLPLLEYAIHDALMQKQPSLTKEQRIEIAEIVKDELRAWYPVMTIDEVDFTIVPVKGEAQWLMD